jgi:septal ring factor EnvC (AmiA/AmiB activator)
MNDKVQDAVLKDRENEAKAARERCDKLIQENTALQASHEKAIAAKDYAIRERGADKDKLVERIVEQRKQIDALKAEREAEHAHFLAQANEREKLLQSTRQERDKLKRQLTGTQASEQRLEAKLAEIEARWIEACENEDTSILDECMDKVFGSADSLPRADKVRAHTALGDKREINTDRGLGSQKHTSAERGKPAKKV